jgi:two-component system, NarL family, response regulator YdfI
VTRIFIVAAPLRTRRELVALLDHVPEFEIVGAAGSLETATEDWEELKLDVLLMRDTGESSEELLDWLEENGLARQTPVLLIVDETTQGKVNRAMQLGIRGILPANSAPTQVISAVHSLAAGLMVFHPGETACAIASSPSGDAEVAELLEPLTPRERQVLKMLASGLGNKQIAAHLKISEHTAKFHVASILSKLGASSRTAAVSLGLRRGLLLL